MYFSQPRACKPPWLRLKLAWHTGLPLSSIGCLACARYIPTRLAVIFWAVCLPHWDFCGEIRRAIHADPSLDLQRPLSMILPSSPSRWKLSEIFSLGRWLRNSQQWNSSMHGNSWNSLKLKQKCLFIGRRCKVLRYILLLRHKI